MKSRTSLISLGYTEIRTLPISGTDRGQNAIHSLQAPTYHSERIEQEQSGEKEKDRESTQPQPILYRPRLLFLFDPTPFLPMLGFAPLGVNRDILMCKENKRKKRVALVTTRKTTHKKGRGYRAGAPLSMSSYSPSCIRFISSSIIGFEVSLKSRDTLLPSGLKTIDPGLDDVGNTMLPFLEYKFS